MSLCIFSSLLRSASFHHASFPTRMAHHKYFSSLLSMDTTRIPKSGGVNLSHTSYTITMHVSPNYYTQLFRCQPG